MQEIQSGIQRVVQDCIEKEKNLRLLFQLTIAVLAVTTLLFASDIIGLRFI